VPLGWAGDVFHFRHPLDFLGHDGGGGIGAGPGLTVGAALALRGTERIVLGILGDGDFIQGATALWTAAHYEIPALFIISNNRSNFNDEVHQEAVAKMRGREVSNRWIGQRIDSPEVDLCALAKAQGVASSRPVGTAAELEAEIARGLDVVAGGRPYLIDARVATGYANPPLSRGAD
jgi:thiamine pyrophosphate-dependent acetolactate synthase large subunit-like protein